MTCRRTTADGSPSRRHRSPRMSGQGSPRYSARSSASTPPAAVIQPIFEDHHLDQDVGQLVQRAIDGDLTVLSSLEERLPDWNREGRMAILRNPLAARDRMVAVLRAWQERFVEIEPRIVEIIERDFDGRAADRESLAPTELIEATTG